MLSLYSRTFSSVEIDTTFYGTPRESTVRLWERTTPPNFVFCPKVPRLLTHDMRLREVERPLAEFVAAMGLLGAKRGPLLIQLPPAFTIDDFGALESLLPRLSEIASPDVRFAVEFRHASLLQRDVFDLLRATGVALVAADYASMPRRFVVTAPFTYLRLIGKHGSFDTYDHRIVDRSEEIARWADVILRHESRFDSVYVFCNNEYEGYSPETCRTLQAALGLLTTDAPAALQGRLF